MPPTERREQRDSVRNENGRSYTESEAAVREIAGRPLLQCGHSQVPAGHRVRHAELSAAGGQPLEMRAAEHLPQDRLQIQPVRALIAGTASKRGVLR